MMLLVLALTAVALYIPLSMATWFAPALVTFHGMEALPAMKCSFMGCVRNFLPFLVYGLLLFVIAIAAVIPFGLGLLVFIPMLYGSIYASYKDIFLRPEYP